MKVVLISHTPDVERLCAAAASGCYSRRPAHELLDGTKPDEVLSVVLPSGHHDVIEHASFTFSVEGVSRSLTHQLVRYRHGSYSQQSLRYVELDRPQYILPASIGKIPRARKVFEKHMAGCWKAYGALLKSGVPAEDARFTLPLGTATHITFTMNCRELIHFFNQRLCLRSQWEIRRLARLMLNDCRKVAPFIFRGVGPDCVMFGYCREVLQCDELKGKVPMLWDLTGRHVWKRGVDRDRVAGIVERTAA